MLRRLLEPLSLILLAAGIVSVADRRRDRRRDHRRDPGAFDRARHRAGRTRRQGRGGAAPLGGAEGRGQARRQLSSDRGRDRSFPATSCACGPATSFRPTRLILESTAFTAGEAALTGEPYPVEKRPGAVTATSPGEASNALFRGAVAQTGEAIALVVKTGRATRVRRRRVGAGRGAGALAVPARPA